MDETGKTLNIQEKLIANELNHFIEENNVEDSMFTIEEVDNCIKD